MNRQQPNRGSELSPDNLQQLKNSADDLVAEARRIIKQRQSAELTRNYKSDGTIVTNVDTEIEESLRAMLKRRFPEHGILGEEFGAENPAAPIQWILDPVDGTENFSRGIPTFGVIVAVHFNRQPVVGIIDHPVLDLNYSAVKGRGTFLNGLPLRIAGIPQGREPRREVFAVSNPLSALISGECRPLVNFFRNTVNVRVYGDCFAHTRAIEGQVGAMIAMKNKPWDLAASQILVEEAGGRYHIIQQTEEEGLTKTTAAFGKKPVVDYIVGLIEESKTPV